MDETTPRPGWHVIADADLLALLRRAHEGENPDVLLLEAYANADRTDVEGA